MNARKIPYEIDANLFFFSRSQFPFNVIRSIWASVPNIIFFGTLKHLCYAYRICTFKNTLICTRRNRLNQLRRFKCCMLCIHVPLQCRSIKCSSKSPSSGCVYQEPEKANEMLDSNAEDKKRNSVNCRKISDK